MLSRRKKRGQSAVEFATLIIVVLSALMLMQKYMFRGLAGRWKSVGDSIGQERVYDPNATLECRYASFFRGSTGVWFDQKCFENTCEDACVGPEKTQAACNGCLSGCGNAECIPRGTGSVPPPITEPPVTEPPVTEPPVTEPPVTVCEPNATQDCTPANNCKGEQTCAADGSAWGNCVATEDRCYTATIYGWWQADGWDEDDICTDDPCDPWHHCYGGNARQITVSQGTFRSQLCTSVVAKNTSSAAAFNDANNAVLAACPGSCGYKLSADSSQCGSPGGIDSRGGNYCNNSCSSCCNPIGREGGPTRYLCIGENLSPDFGAPGPGTTTDCVPLGTCE